MGVNLHGDEGWYRRRHLAVNKMLGAIIEQRLAFILPLDLAQAYIPNLHLCKAHWTTKKGEASGRPLGDLSNVDGTPLNTDATADAATADYGPITHPTLEDIAVMVDHQHATPRSGKRTYDYGRWTSGEPTRSSPSELSMSGCLGCCLRATSSNSRSVRRLCRMHRSQHQ